jgi:hypothetical protein
VRDECSRGDVPVGSPDAVAGSREWQKLHAGISPRLPLPCGSENIGSAVRWMTNDDAVVDDSGSRFLSSSAR